ncbi:LysR family transcriptional regulator [Marinobacter sp. F3R08]|uniref:LysR family transcriptional regulator n=1 Tax=Marinobacter sp. F3R08 TaxID=2841559 RepID=UPI001C0A1E79|nr:LysR family transcriptional regulator [Marinobacter sp. F3R08]MBU2954799.1 LysR family transcriptional regulator [Marinobacter sp. F3R08]
MNLSDIDLKLLRVFHAVVEAGGFTSAQTVLNVSPSTISSHMSQLEARIGFVLCERGRSGFRLTTKGEAFHQNVLAFFGAVYALEASAEGLRRGTIESVRIGIIDNLVTDKNCPLHKALGDLFSQPDSAIELSIQVLSPQDIERELLEQNLDIGIGIFYQSSQSLDYRPLYQERDVLVCSGSNALANLKDPRKLAQEITSAPKVVRNFMQKQEFPFIGDDDNSVIAAVTNVESAAFMILNGPFIGFLPYHYAQRWIASGDLMGLLPDKFIRYSQVSLVTRRNDLQRSPVLTNFIRRLEKEHKVHRHIAR